MRKADIANEIYKQVGISKNEAADIVELVLNMLKAVCKKAIPSKSPDLAISSFEARAPERPESTDRRRDWHHASPRRDLSSESGIQEIRQLVTFHTRNNSRHEDRSMGNEPRLGSKVFYKIGEVSQVTKLPAYVLRFWESEFPFLKPKKSRGNQRLYVRKMSKRCWKSNACSTKKGTRWKV